MSCLISLLSLLDFLFLPLLISFSFIPSFLPPLFFYPLFPEVTLLPIFFKYIFQDKRTQFFSVNRLCVRDQGSLQEEGEDGNHRSFAGARNALECERGYIQRIIFLLWKQSETVLQHLEPSLTRLFCSCVMMNKSVLIGQCNLRARNLMYLHNIPVSI